MTRRSAAAACRSESTNASLIRLLQLRECRGEFFLLRRAVMPQHRAFHETDAFSFDRVRDDTPWPVRRCGGSAERFRELLMIMAVDFNNVPPEGAPFVGKRLEPQCLVDRCETLHLVVINDRDKIREAMVSGEDHGFPNGPL